MASSEFARKQMEKHGWTKGAGLGKEEHGIAEPIKVNLKMDKTGVGHDPGKEFTDHWWLRVFNDAAKKIGTKDQTKTKKKSVTEVKMDRRQAFYSGFIKSSTLTNGVEEKVERSDSSSSDDDSSDAQSVPTLNDIHKFCGGATGHKAARFGYKMGGKLSRVAKHDKMVEERLQKSSLNSHSDEDQNGDTPSPSEPVNEEEEKIQKVRKKKKKNGTEADDNVELADQTDIQNGVESEKKKKKHKKTESVGDMEASDNVVESEKKRKKKKRKKESVEQVVVTSINSEEDLCDELSANKKKKSKKNCEETEDSQDTPYESSSRKKKKKRKLTEEEAEVPTIKKKKKHKKDRLIVDYNV